MQEFLYFLVENWQFIFLYCFKYLYNIRQGINNLVKNQEVHEAKTETKLNNLDMRLSRLENKMYN